MENCPKCGCEYDPEEDDVMECVECGEEGSTLCCMPFGRDTMCIDCEEQDDE